MSWVTSLLNQIIVVKSWKNISLFFCAFSQYIGVSVWEAKWWPLKISRPWSMKPVNVTLHSKKDFAGVIKLWILRWGHYPGLCPRKRGAEGHLDKNTKQCEDRAEEDWKTLRCWLWRWRKAPWTKGSQFLEAGRGREMDSLLEPPERGWPCRRFDLFLLKLISSDLWSPKL